MEVQTTTEHVERQRAVLTELLLADQPPPEEDPKETTTGDNELLALVRRYGVGQDGGLPRGGGRGTDSSNPVIAVDHDACILCDRCVRACDDVQGNDVIGRSGKGYATRIAFDLNDPMGESSCVTCGECVAACPTGALVNKPIGGTPIRRAKSCAPSRSVCPYCGVGCALTYHVDDERGRIAYADGPRAARARRAGCASRAATAGTTPASPQRLTVPLIRREGSYPKGPLSGDVRGEGRGRRRPGGLVDYDEVMPALPRGELGRGARSRRAPADGHPRRARPSGDRRVRLGEVLQRGGLPLPEAHPRRLRHQQRRPLHPAVPRVQRRRAVRGRRLGRGVDDVRRHRQRRRRHPGRHQHDGQPPGRRRRSSSRPAGAARR